MSTQPYNGKWAPVPVPDLQNWNTDRSPDSPVMVRGAMYKTSAGSWLYSNGEDQGGLGMPNADYFAMAYTGENLTSVVSKIGGASGTTVATLYLGYDGSSNLSSVSKE